MRGTILDQKMIRKVLFPCVLMCVHQPWNMWTCGDDEPSHFSSARKHWKKYYLGQDYFGNDFDENNRNVCFHTKILFVGDITPFLNPALITFLRRVDILWVVLLSHLFHNMGSTSRVFGCHEKNSIWFLSCLKLHTKNVISTSVITSKSVQASPCLRLKLSHRIISWKNHKSKGSFLLAYF